MATATFQAKLQQLIQAQDPNGYVWAVRRPNQWLVVYASQDDQYNGGVYKFNIAAHGKLLASETVYDTYSGVHCTAADMWDLLVDSGVVAYLVSNS